MMAASWTQDGPKMAQDGHHTASKADFEHMLRKIIYLCRGRFRPKGEVPILPRKMKTFFL